MYFIVVLGEYYYIFLLCIGDVVFMYCYCVVVVIMYSNCVLGVH